MFYDLAEQVFILKISIWRPESENREKSQSVAILITNIAYKFIEQPEKAGITFPKILSKSLILRNMVLELKMIMKMNSLTPNYYKELLSDFAYDQ